MLKNKKILLTVFVLLLLIIIPTMVKAATIEATETTSTSTGAIVNWSYELDGDNIKNLKCTNVSSVIGELTIPSTIDGHTVTSIGSSAFDGCSGLRKVIIPNTVTSIGSYAFSNCTGLTNITIPNSVTSIGNSAFNSCSGIKSVTLSNNLTKLNDYTFSGCSGITEIALPENLTTIGYYALKCENLKFVKIPENVASIDDAAFGWSTTENLTIYGKEGSTAQTYAESKNINFEKIENWDNRNSNSGSDITCPTVSSMKIKYSNIMDYYNQTTNDYRVPSGVEIAIIVEFTETLNGTQTPTLTIKCGTGQDIELKNGVLSGKNIVYTYKIQKNDEGLITAIKLEGGNISDNDGNKAKLSVKELTVQYNSGYAYANGSVEGTTNQTGNSNNNTDKSSGSTTNNGSSTDNKKDTTIAKTVLPYTGKVILVWIIAIVAVSAIVAHVRYKKLYIK